MTALRVVRQVLDGEAAGWWCRGVYAVLLGSRTEALVSDRTDAERVAAALDGRCCAAAVAALRKRLREALVNCQERCEDRIEELTDEVLADHSGDKAGRLQEKLGKAIQKALDEEIGSLLREEV